MKDVCVALKVLLAGQSAPMGYQKIPCHMIFEIKMKHFQCIPRLVAGGHRTKAPASIIHTSVVFCETVCLALLKATVNDLKVTVGDVLNTYITAPITEKVWAVFGPKFGSDAS
jgi:hypothetical protein